MKILIAEDDALSKRLLSIHLRKYEHVITEAKDGAEAWKIFQREPFQVLICDWLMPEMDGIELCMRARSFERSSYTYIILLTVLEGKKNYLQAMQAGADDFITKPFDPEELQARLIVARRVLNLQTEVTQLRGMLPTCSYCKKIRDENNNWIQMEEYVASRSEATFIHGICPSCYQEYVKPELERNKRNS